jgi:competence protein ComEA
LRQRLLLLLIGRAKSNTWTGTRLAHSCGKEAVMGSRLVRWIFRVGPGSAFLLSLLFSSLAVTQSSAGPSRPHYYLLDINRATVEQLKAIPEIGEVYADKIIQSRPYQRKDELVEKGIIPPAIYDKIKDKIAVWQK